MKYRSRMKYYSYLALMMACISIQGQTGPGGVDNSANNVLWLKADAGTNTTTNGAAVSSWADQSGNGNSVSQSTANQQPLYQTNVINGFPTILFDNTTNTNDYFSGADSPTLDNTSGVSIFTVTRTLNLDNSTARSIISKRNNVDVDESYMFFYYTSNKVYADVQTTNDRFNTSTAFSNNNNYIIDLIYDGTLATANRSKIYIGESLDVTKPETHSSIPDNPSPLVIGSTNIGDGRPFGGHMAEIIVFRKALNAAERIIVNNHLSSKYNIALSANDYYAGDNSGSGDYDYDVCGIGTDASGSNTAFSTGRCAGLGIAQVSGFGNGDYLLAGHKVTTNYLDSTDVTGITGSHPARWGRVWYWDFTDAGTAMTLNVRFNLYDGGWTSTQNAGLASNYKLVYRAGQTGAWTTIATASITGGATIFFNGVTPSADGYYTIATLNTKVSTLPVELLNFSATENGDKVDLKWETATETNNAYFTIEKSKDGKTFTQLVDVPGAGNSVSYREYFDTDYEPYEGLSYYRLKQTDINGDYHYFPMVSINRMAKQQISTFPNPAAAGENVNMEMKGLANHEVLVVLRDMNGKEFFSKVYLVAENDQLTAIDAFHTLPAGTYLLIASSGKLLHTQKVIVK